MRRMRKSEKPTWTMWSCKQLNVVPLDRLPVGWSSVVALRDTLVSSVSLVLQDSATVRQMVVPLCLVYPVTVISTQISVTRRRDVVSVNTIRPGIPVTSVRGDTMEMRSVARPTIVSGVLVRITVPV